MALVLSAPLAELRRSICSVMMLSVTFIAPLHAQGQRVRTLVGMVRSRLISSQKAQARYS